MVTNFWILPEMKTFQTTDAENIKTQVMFQVHFSENRAVYGIITKIPAQQNRP